MALTKEKPQGMCPGSGPHEDQSLGLHYRAALLQRQELVL